MRYVSTRGRAPTLDFAGATLAGLAPDGGLYVPEAWPALVPGALAALRGAPWTAAFTAALAPLAGDALGADALEAIAHEVAAGFGHPDVTPLSPLGDGLWLLELHHGPTLAFKDVGLRTLAALFRRLLPPGELLTILGATSGDTGSAAIHALKDVPGIRVVMLHPLGRTSNVQRRQMTCVDAPTIHNIAIEGDFDAAQAIVKAILKDPPLGARLSAINSINWARLAAQASYYLFAAARLPGDGGPPSFAVPTGNFGDVFAGYAAARMGLAVGRLIVATNANDILHRALGRGDYSRAAVQPTQSPSMDIQVSSNFERLLFDLHGRDPAALAAAMAGFEASGRLALSGDIVAAARRWFDSAAIGEDETAATMRWAWETHGRLICPHSAVGVAAARRALAAGTPGPIVVLETAHPAKFPDAVRAATGRTPEPPARLAAMLAGEERFDVLPASEPAIRAAVARVALGG